MAEQQQPERFVLVSPEGNEHSVNAEGRINLLAQGYRDKEARPRRANDKPAAGKDSGDKPAQQ